jgi:hypothetical protein
MRKKVSSKMVLGCKEASDTTIQTVGPVDVGQEGTAVTEGHEDTHRNGESAKEDGDSKSRDEVNDDEGSGEAFLEENFLLLFPIGVAIVFAVFLLVMCTS